MTLDDLGHFYLGNADAIRQLAADPWTLAIGALLVLSAGLARHYDSHDLRQQWWRLLVPFAASTLAATGLFLVLLPITRGGSATFSMGLGLLGLFWLTAPLAWLYGLPFERLWPPQQAARNRRWALAIVAAGRVTLMTRCVGVLLGYDGWSSLLIVAGFAVPAALLAMSLASLLMHRSEQRQLHRAEMEGVAAARIVINGMAMIPDNIPEDGKLIVPFPDRPNLEPPSDPSAGCALGCLALIVFVLSAVALPAWIGLPQRWPPEPMGAAAGTPSPAVWEAATLAVLFWVPWLLLCQPAQWRRTWFIQRLCFAPLEETIRDLAARHPGDFPQRWDPAAVLAREEFAGRMLEAARLAADLPAESWVRRCFLNRLGPMVPLWLHPLKLWLEQREQMQDDQLRNLAWLQELLRKLPEGPELLQPHRDYLDQLCPFTQEHDQPRFEVLQNLSALALGKTKPFQSGRT